jgi:murein DD-endopeptidase MepM/ murein hydrolase activator NlpD
MGQMKKNGRGYIDHSAYTLMFFPEGRGSPFTLRIRRHTIYLVVASIIVITFGLAVLLYKTGDIAVKLQYVQDLKTENARLREHNKDLEISSRKIVSIDSMTAYLRRLASIADINESVAPAPAAVASARPEPASAAPAAERADGQAARAGAQSATPAEFAASVPNIMPVAGWITKHFSTDPAAPHLGVDIAAAGGTPIKVAATGVVEEVRNDRYYGLMVEIRHESGFLTRYGHCSQVLVSAGDKVNRGQTIALVGNTGRSTAPHVHYEVMTYGKHVDPMGFIGAHKQ